MKAKKTIEVLGLKLNRPTATISSVRYDWSKDIAIIELHFQEENAIFWHSRNIEMSTGGDIITPADIKDFVKSELKDFE